MVPARIHAARLVTMLGPASPGTASYQWLSDSIRLLISDGRLLHGTRLPSERDLVGATGLSRTTVSRAYAELRERGYATAQHGSGTTVQVPGGPVTGGGEPMPMPLEEDLAGAEVVDLRNAAMSGPVGLAAAYERAARRLGAFAAGPGYFPLGVPELREAIAVRFTERGAPTDPDQIVVTAGALAGMAAVARALLRRGDRVVLESPGYPGTLAGLRHEGVRMAPVATSSGQTDLDAMAERLRGAQPRAMVLLPDFHNPTGTLMADDQRARIARLWRRHGVRGIVDETVAELWLDAPPEVGPMAAHAPSAVTIGSLSKSHWGGLRIGWLRVPPDLVGAIARARSTFDLGAPVLEQLVAAELMRDNPSLDEARRRRIRARRDWLVAAIGAALPDWEAVVPPGGLSLWWHLPRPRSSALVTAARAEGVLLAAGSAFAVEGHGLERWVRIPYALETAQLERAVPLIARAWAQVS